MAITKAQARRVRQPTFVGDLEVTGTLSANPSVEILELSSIAEKITVQSSGTLAGNLEISVNGTDWLAATAFVATTIVSYNTHLIRLVRVTRTGGTGRLHLIAR
jgi:hypothetical protein